MSNSNQILVNLLNLTAQEVDSVNSVNDDNSLSYYVTLKKKPNSVCPICGNMDKLFKGYYKKKQIVSNDLFCSSGIYLRIPRYLCKKCNHSFSIVNKLSPPNNTISYSLIIKVMNLLTDSKLTFRSVASLTGISETSVMRIFDKYCHISKVTFPETICIDEVYTKDNDYKSKYSCIIYDFYNERIVDALPCRKKEYLSKYFDQFVSSGQLLAVHYVSIDMYLTYKLIAKKYFKKAIICVDPFHVIQLINNCLSKLRIRLMNSYSQNSNEYYLLKYWKNLLFTSNLDCNYKKKYNKVFKRELNYYDILQLMFSISPQLAIAYQLKEQYMSFNRNSSIEQARNEFPNIYNSFVKANIPEFYDFVSALANWKDEIINSFTIYKGRRINSSIAESMNARISELMYNTKGIRNHERRKKRIMYCINKDGFSLKL